jgi:hypothetical protein
MCTRLPILSVVHLPVLAVLACWGDKDEKAATVVAEALQVHLDLPLTRRSSKLNTKYSATLNEIRQLPRRRLAAIFFS